ncbi:hypothetical protein EDB19DRAFT_1834200 [Suillus lakei]|nr:hypothetical protein EDB19DRAFT_1834200 [Suillus lakei]
MLAMPMHVITLVWVPHLGLCNSFYKESGAYTLGPAKFASHTDPPSPSSSCIVMHQVLSNGVIDPVLLPLPDTGDLDLTDAVTIAEACGYIPAAKTAGSSCKAKAARGKGKGKENIPLTTVHLKYCQWAKVNHWPSHKITSLEMNYKQLVKTVTNLDSLLLYKLQSATLSVQSLVLVSRTR